MDRYEVSYSIPESASTTHGTITLQLYTGSASEAIEKLYSMSRVPRSKQIIIDSIKRV